MQEASDQHNAFDMDNVEEMAMVIWRGWSLSLQISPMLCYSYSPLLWAQNTLVRNLCVLEAGSCHVLGYDTPTG